jgi:HEAT repeat protein
LPINGIVVEKPSLLSQEDSAVNSAKNDVTIETLIENLQDPDQIVRIHAATVLGSMGEDAESAVPALVDLVTKGDIHDRKLAVLTLGEIGPAAEEAIPALFAAIEDEDDGLAELAVAALEQIDLVDDDAAAA